MTIVPTSTLAELVLTNSGENAYLCYQCQRCSSGCPTSSAMSITPTQMMRLAQFGLEGRLVGDASIWRCLGCDSCAEHCPYGISPRRVIEWLRQRAMQDYYLADKPDTFAHDESLVTGIRALSLLGLRVRSHHNVSGEDNSSRLAWTANLAGGASGLDGQPQAEMIYFVGCVSAMFPMSYGIPQSFSAILARLGSSFTTLGGREWCCGYPLMMAGQLEQARATMAHNVEQMQLSGADRLVATCPSCYHMWKHVYPQELGGDLPFSVVTASEVLCDLLQRTGIGLTQLPRPGVVTYHDPCDLGRKGGQYDEPREVLGRVPGIRFVEMQNTRQHALCCGGGGDLETFSPDLTGEVAKKRVAQAVEVGADYLISACPQCVRTLSKAVREQRLRIRVMDLVQLVAAALPTS